MCACVVALPRTMYKRQMDQSAPSVTWRVLLITILVLPIQ